MRIHITSNEIYEINIPMDKEFSKQEFSVFVSRLNQIMKLLGKDEVLEIIKQSDIGERAYIKKEYKERKNILRPFSKNREIALQILHTNYFGTKEQKEEIAKQFNMSWNELNKALFNIRKKWKVQPQELGLKEFPTKLTFQNFRENKNAWRL